MLFLKLRRALAQVAPSSTLNTFTGPAAGSTHPRFPHFWNMQVNFGWTSESQYPYIDMNMNPQTVLESTDSHAVGIDIVSYMIWLTVLTTGGPDNASAWYTVFTAWMTSTGTGLGYTLENAFIHELGAQTFANRRIASVFGGDSRYVVNPSDPGIRYFFANVLIPARWLDKSADKIFVDDFAADVYWTCSIVSSTGPSPSREYNLGSDAANRTQTETDIGGLIDYIVGVHGKKFILNTSAAVSSPFQIFLGKAGGCHMESISSLALDMSSKLPGITTMRQVSGVVGPVQICPGFSRPSEVNGVNATTYPAGNENSAPNRVKMFDYGVFLVSKDQAMTKPTALVRYAFCNGYGSGDLFTDNFFEAYRYDLGVPTAAAYDIAETGLDPLGQPVTIYHRQFTSGAHVYVRANVGSATSTDASKYLLTTVPGTCNSYLQLNGTKVPTFYNYLRQGEAVIMLPSAAPSPSAVSVTASPASQSVNTSAGPFTMTFHAWTGAGGTGSDMVGQPITVTTSNSPSAAISPTTGPSPLTVTITPGVSGTPVITGTSNGHTATDTITVTDDRVFADTMAGADANPIGTASGGFTWLMSGSSNIKRLSNLARGTAQNDSSGRAYCYVDTGVANQNLWYRIGATGGTSGGLVYRWQDSLNFNLAVSMGNGEFRFYTVAAGSYTLAFFHSFTPAVGDIIAVTLSGSTVTATCTSSTGTTKLATVTHTITNCQTATKHGMSLHAGSADGCSGWSTSVIT